jgi:Cu(I)/Ag(I) efflux system membrane fusion protein/cobalt-zinc-cadmium efflux system membrane fusion protein
MTERNYKQAFVAATAICVVLAAALGYLLVHQDRTVAAPEETSPVVAKGPDLAGQPSPAAPPSATSALALTPVQISAQRLQAIGVKTAVVEMRAVNDEVRASGNVEVNEQQLAYVQTRFPGWIQKVFANATYQYVRKGDPMFTIYSQELVSTEQEYLLAKQSQKSFTTEEHGAPAKESDWLLQAAIDRLRQFGVSPREIASLEQTSKVQRELTVESPVSGYITERNALPNLFVQPETKLYAIADLSTVWVYANVFQSDVGRLKPGDPAAVTTDAYPGRTFHGRIDQVLPQVDVMTRTVRVRLVFNNPGIVLKPGMYVNVGISIPLGRQLVIPASAALQTGTRQIAFIDHGEGYLEPREIEVGQRLDDHMVVLKGLREGERIVSSANFLVDSESQLQAAMGSFAPPPPGPGQAAAMNTPAEKISIAFSTDPDPPRKGSNSVRVKLTRADGKLVTGVKVTATFFVPAMPAMGMAAMRNLANLAEKGGGIYQGPVQLQVGGTWQITLIAQRDGKTVASKQLSVTAAGGM